MTETAIHPDDLSDEQVALITQQAEYLESCAAGHDLKTYCHTATHRAERATQTEAQAIAYRIMAGALRDTLVGK